MQFTSSLILALPVIVSAFPFMPQPDESMLKQAEKETREAHEARQLSITNTIGIVSGLLGSVASNVSPADKRPEPNHPFQAPSASDSRGPCPGLNLLANHGYLPRNGYVSFGQVVEATARGFNMGTDLATILAVFATLSDGTIADESWWLGTDPTHSDGLNRHSTVEADISPNREDFYLGCGDNHHVSSRLVKQNVGFAAASASKQFDIPVMGQQYLANSKFSQKNNPYLYYFPFPSIVSVVAFNFYPAYFSNGTYGLGGVANYESISSIVGFQLNKNTGNYDYVPERFPENWYRRSYEYGAVQALTEGFTEIYPLNPVPMGVSQLAEPQYLNLNTILCNVYQGVNSITAQGFRGGLADAGAAVAWAGAKLDLLSPGTIAGCPTNAVSNSYFPVKKGGAMSEPPSVFANSGNNVYNKAYFTTAPSTPQCNHVSS